MTIQRPGQAPGYADNFAYEPTTRRERSIAIGLAAALTLVSVVLVPFAHVRLSAEPTLLLVVESIAIVALLLTGSTLFAQYRARRYAPVALLGIGFGVYGLGHVLYIGMFPGMFSKAGIFGAGSQCAFWTYVFARLLFATMVMVFTYAEWRERRGTGLRRTDVARIGYGALTAMLAVAIAVTGFHQFLPAIVGPHDQFSELFLTRVQPLGIVWATTALVALVCICGLRTRVSVWLSVTVLAQILEMIMGGSLGGSRFSVGWYSARIDLAISSVLFIVAMQVQLAGILQRAARASTRAHTLFSLSTADGSSLAINAKLIEAALLELDFEWGFITRFEDGHVTIETSVGAVPTDRDPRSKLESSLLHGVTSRELFVMENSTTQSGDRHAQWGAFASVPIFVEGRLYGSAGFASRARRKSLINDADRDFMYLLGILAGSAIERDRRAQRLTGLAFYDSLTGLPNRAQLLEKLNERVAAGQRYGTPFAVHFLDLDFFKPINDRYGHAVGDEVLREIASRLRQSVREGDVVARLGGDEFVVVQKLDTSGSDAESLRDRMVKSFDAPIVTRAASLTIGASVGIARFPEDGRDADELLAAADKAQYRVKNRRRWIDPAKKATEISRVVPLERRKGSGSP